MALVASTIASLLFYASVMAIVVSVLLTALLHYHAKEVKWVEKESESLHALAKDFDQLLKDVAETETQARSFWDSEVNLAGLIHVQLGKDETRWMESITEMVGDAKNCVTIFKQLSQELHLTACFRVVLIVDFVLQIKRIKRAIVGKLTQNEMHIRDIYESMERSRSKNRSMLHVLYSFQENDSIPTLEPVEMMQFSTSIIDLIRRRKGFFCGMEEVIWSIYSLLLLHVFLMDVSQLEFETETQMISEKQANELIAEAEESIDNFGRLVLTFGNNQILRNKFRRGMKSISTAVDNLLNKKGEYHFEFIDRATEKSIISFSLYPDTGGMAIVSSTMKSTLSDIARQEEEELGEEQVHEINSMFNSLENSYHSSSENHRCLLH